MPKLSLQKRALQCHKNTNDGNNHWLDCEENQYRRKLPDHEQKLH